MPPTSFKPAALAALACLTLFSTGHGATIATWDGATAAWTDATHWSTATSFPNNIGATTFDAVINVGAVTLDQAISINRLTLGGGLLEGAASLTALEGMQWTGGAIRGTGTLTLGAAVPTTISGGAQPLILSARTVNLSGATNFTAGTIQGGSNATINNAAGATFTASGNASFFADFVTPAYTFANAGTFVARSTTGAGFTSMDARFQNSGTVRVELGGVAVAHTLSLAGGGTHSGAFQLGAGTAVELGGNTILQSGVSFTGLGETIIAGSIAATGDVTADHLTVAVGQLDTGASVVSAAVSGLQTGGTTRIGAGGILRVGGGSGTWLLDDGTLTGQGTLEASLEAQGAIAPGLALGTLQVTGSVLLGSDARLLIEIGGPGAGAFDVLAVTGPASLGGELRITLADGFRPDGAQTFTILSSSALAGVFANAPLDGARFSTADGLGSFQVDYTPQAVVLTSFVPEPSSLVLCLGGAVLCAIRRPRRGSTRS